MMIGTVRNVTIAHAAPKEAADELAENPNPLLDGADDDRDGALHHGPGQQAVELGVRGGEALADLGAPALERLVCPPCTRAPRKYVLTKASPMYASTMNT